VATACAAAQERWGIGAAIQVGDFGFFPRILRRYLAEEHLRFPVPLHVIDGNHEDHKWLRRAVDSGEAERWLEADLHVHRRGTVSGFGGASVGFLGGALHADRRQEWAGQWIHGKQARIPVDPEWANWVTQADCRRALDAFTAAPPDLLVTHSCPGGIGIGIPGHPALLEPAERFISNAGFRAGPFDDCGDGGLTRLWEGLTVKPPTWVFGHFHRLHDHLVGGTRFVCVGSSDDTDGRPAITPVIYDTDTRTLTIHHERPLER
jgi:hypothetical protein